jgi:hypothetical protein
MMCELRMFFDRRMELKDGCADHVVALALQHLRMLQRIAVFFCEIEHLIDGADLVF